jgi:hypothetical protein
MDRIDLLSASSHDFVFHDDDHSAAPHDVVVSDKNVVKKPANTKTSVFLGDELSVHEPKKHPAASHMKKTAGISEKALGKFIGHDAHSDITIKSVLQAMPFDESASTLYGCPNDLLKSIPHNCWMFPYIVATALILTSGYAKRGDKENLESKSAPASPRSPAGAVPHGIDRSSMSFSQILAASPSFRPVGYIYMSRDAGDPRGGGSWEKRVAFLWDNYLLEATSDGTPIGFCMLHDAEMRLTEDRGALCPRGQQQAGGSGSGGGAQMVSLSFCPTPDPDCARQTVFLRAADNR